MARLRKICKRTQLCQKIKKWNDELFNFTDFFDWFYLNTWSFHNTAFKTEIFLARQLLFCISNLNFIVIVDVWPMTILSLISSGVIVW